MRPEMLGSRAVELLFTDRNVQKLIVQYELWATTLFYFIFVQTVAQIIKAVYNSFC
jgi:hypothetical protein